MRSLPAHFRISAKGRRIRQLSTLVCFDEMATRTMLLSEASAVVGVCSHRGLGGEATQHCDRS
jgi:hypothetical protein